VSSIGTRTVDTTATFVEQVMRVTRPVRTELLQIVEMYGHLSVDEAVNYILDFRDLMSERFLSEIEIVWTSRFTALVLDGLRYAIRNGEAVRTMSRPGGLAYDVAIKGANFSILIYYTSLWHAQSDAYKAEFTRGLRIPWSRAAAPNYGGGRYVDDGREYGQSSVGISRLRFTKA